MSAKKERSEVANSKANKQKKKEVSPCLYRRIKVKQIELISLSTLAHKKRPI